MRMIIAGPVVVTAVGMGKRLARFDPDGDSAYQCKGEYDSACNRDRLPEIRHEYVLQHVGAIHEDRDDAVRPADQNRQQLAEVIVARGRTVVVVMMVMAVGMIVVVPMPMFMSAVGAVYVVQVVHDSL